MKNEDESKNLQNDLMEYMWSNRGTETGHRNASLMNAMEELGETEVAAI